MGIGTGIFLLAAGAVLAWAIDVDLPYIDDDALGMILAFVGLAVVVISVIVKSNRPEPGIGTGIGLIAVGAVLAWAVDVDLPYIDDWAMGTILMIAGLVAVVATVIVQVQRARERRAAHQQAAYGYYPPDQGYPQQYQQYRY